MSERPFFEIQVGEFLPQHDLSGNTCHGNVADFGYEGHGSGCPWVGFQYVDHIVCNGILDIHETHDIKFHSDLLRVVADGIDMPHGNTDWRNYTSRIARMNSGKLDVLHHRGNESIGPVRNRIRLGLDGVFQKPIYEDGALRRHSYSRGHVTLEHLFVVNHLHSPPAENIGGTHHEGIADFRGNLDSFLDGTCHS